MNELNWRTLKVLFWLIGFPFLAKSQFTYVVDQSISVKDGDNNTLPIAWSGGLNAAQYNTMDINGDNVPDLVLFDRMANKVITFLNADRSYRYAPEYESLFPELTNWLLLRDFNCDGKKDLFTGDALGIRVFTNVTQPGGLLEWEQFLFYTGSGDTKSQVLLTKGFSGLTNLQLQFDDLPAISDIDGDGDVDILCMRYPGEGSVEFHKNFSMERHETCDSLEFERVTQKWGNVLECECGTFAFDDTECPPDGGGRTKHAGGKALLALDIDNDQDQDLLISEAECTALFLLENKGDATNALFTDFVSYPPAEPAQFSIFPAPFYEDVNFDHVNDLVVVPNVFNRTVLEVDLRNSNWYYQNIGSLQTPSFSLVEKNFLQNKMIDVGDNAVPAFFDMDGDGDQDMIIGYNADAESLSGAIYFYENTGTSSVPSFTFITDDYLEIGSLFLLNVKPQFADANADGKMDLVFSATSSITGQTNLYALYNKKNSGVDFSEQLLNTIDFNMLFSENILMIDVDQDGLADILIGKSNGSVEYWKNNGPKGSYNFLLVDNSYKELGPSVERQSLALTSADLNADGKADLILGDQFGTIGIISDYRQATEAAITTNIVYNELKEEYIAQNLGGRIWPTTADIFNSGKPAIISGNIMGGIQVMRYDTSNSGQDSPSIEIYPIPVHHTQSLNIKIDRSASVQLVSLLGQELNEPVELMPNVIQSFEVSEFASGLYILRILVNNKTYSRRIVIY